MKMNISTTTKWIIAGLGVTALGVAGYFILKKKQAKNETYHNPKYNNKGYKISKGVKTTKAKATPLSEPNWSNPYDMNYKKDVMAWVHPKKIRLLSKTDAQNYAKQLKEAYGGSWYKNDDEDAVKAVFSKKLQDKVAVAIVSEAFWNRYKKDMWEYLKSFLSRKEMENYVHRPVRALPNYRIIT